MFAIDQDKNIFYVGAGVSLPGGSNFSTEAALQSIADAKQWTREDLEGIWNGFVGVVPFDNLRSVKKFRNRPYGIRQIWNAIQRLAPEDQQQVSKGVIVKPKKEKKETEPKAVKAKKEPKVNKPPKVKAAKKTKGPKVEHAGRGEKREIVMSLLARERGATVPEIMEKTGWLPHSTRGYLSTIQSKGFVKLAKEKDAKRGLVYRAA